MSEINNKPISQDVAFYETNFTNCEFSKDFLKKVLKESLYEAEVYNVIHDMLFNEFRIHFERTNEELTTKGYTKYLITRKEYQDYLNSIGVYPKSCVAKRKTRDSDDSDDSDDSEDSNDFGEFSYRVYKAILNSL